MNIAKLLSKSARTFPENLAIAQGSRQLTYARFDARANQLANALYRLGIRPGDNVAVLMYNCPEMLESMFACFKSGCGAVPINFRLHPREFAFIIDHSESRAVIVSPEFNGAIADIRDQIPHARHLITTTITSWRGRPSKWLASDRRASRAPTSRSESSTRTTTNFHTASWVKL
ncbi:MAG: AMP-binding protein [bacterium]|nr:AMP-binding protein [bacterium]